LRPVAGEAGGEKGVLLDLDSPWAARRAGDEIRDNQQRQEDEVLHYYTDSIAKVAGRDLS
jgi:hypothetical protein